VNNTSASLESSPRWQNLSLHHIAGLSLLLLVGSLAAFYPVYVLSCVAAAAVLGLSWVAVVKLRRANLELWQILALIGVSGNLLLNYGFENLAFHVGGIPIIVSYGVMFGSLILAVYQHQNLVLKALKEPAMLCLIGLLVLTTFHLILDVPTYGIWAVRDSSMVVDGVFMIVGLLWSMRRDSLDFFIKWMPVIFVLNMIYSFTLPWGDTLASYSPQSGVFLKVPLLGSYNGTGDILMSGALFCICFTGYVLKRPRWLLMFVVVGQLLGIAITQVRRMYLGAVVVLFLLILLGEAKKFAKLLIVLPVSVLVILLATSFGGLKITGRIGEVNLDFFKEHIRSMSDAEGTPGSSVESRFLMVDEAMQHFWAHPVLGEGFGLPLTNEMDTNNGEGNSAITRTPHNSTISYLARLGVVGIIMWIAFHLCIVQRCISALRRRAGFDPRLSAFVIWFFLFYVLFMISSTVEGAFEFPAFAIPFFFFAGFALGQMRWHQSAENWRGRRSAWLRSAAKA
jgi:hypothetical protein